MSPLLSLISLMVFLGLKKVSGEPVSLPIRWSNKNFLKKVTERNHEGMKQDLTEAVSDEDMVKEICMAMFQLQEIQESREQRRECNQMFLRTLEEVHGGGAGAKIWMIGRLHFATIKMVLADANFSYTVLEKATDLVEDAMEALRRLAGVLGKKLSCWMGWIKAKCGYTPTTSSSSFNLGVLVKTFSEITIFYIDFTKDTAILVLLIAYNQETLFTNFASFPSQITWLIAFSVAAPLMWSAVETSRHHALLLLGYITWRTAGNQEIITRGKTCALKAAVFCGYLIAPAIMICAKQEAHQRLEDLRKIARRQFRETMEVKEEVSEEQRHVTQYVIQAEGALRTYKKNDFALEMTIQLVLQTTMLLMSMSMSRTHTSFEAVFEGDSSGQVSLLLVASILLSFRSSTMTYLAVKAKHKIGLLPLSTKIVMLLRALMAVFTRVSCMVAFFTPTLGLFSYLAHWQVKPMFRTSE